MGLANSPNIVTNGLVFYYDMNNYQKSWVGQPTTNLVGDGMSIYNNVSGDVTASLVTTGEYYRGAPIYKLTLTPTTASGVSYLTAGNNPGIGVVSGGGGGLANRYTGHSIFFRPTVPMHSSPIYTHYSNIGGWQSSTNYYSMNDGWLRAHVIWYDTVTRSDGKYWAINPASATLNVPIVIYWAGPFKEDRNDSAFVSPYVYNYRYANSNLESSPSYPSWNATAGSSASGGTLTFSGGSYNSKSSWDLYKTYSGLSTGTNYTWSALVKIGTASNLIITMNNTQSWNTGPSVVVSGLSSTAWTRVSITGTTNTGSFNLHLGASFNSEVASTSQSAGTVFIQDVRLVLSQSQTAISDLIGQSTITANNLIYASAGTFSFNGSSSFIDSGINIPNTAAFTLSCWVNPANTQVQYSGIMGNHGSGGTTGIYCQQQSTSLNNYHWGYGNGSSWGTACAFSLTSNAWHHLVLVKDSVSNYVYLNGVLVNSVTTNGTAVAGGFNICFGRDYASDRYFNGSIHAGQIYSRALTAEEVNRNFNAQRGLYGI